MELEPKAQTGPAEKASRPHRVRLPGFTAETEVGLGDLIKQFTYAFGIKSCEGCERRAAFLNRWMVFTSQRGT
jgi:hypothetical protein